MFCSILLLVALVAPIVAMCPYGGKNSRRSHLIAISDDADWMPQVSNMIGLCKLPPVLNNVHSNSLCYPHLIMSFYSSCKDSYSYKYVGSPGRNQQSHATAVPPLGT